MEQSNEGPAGFEAVPGNIRSLIETIGFLPAAELDDDANLVLLPARDGRCMTCHSPLGPDTALIINKRGVCAAYCGGACMQDMAVLGWVQEAHQDIVDRVEFRGGGADEDHVPES